MRNERAVELEYEDAQGSVSVRTVWPIQLAYYEQKEIIAAWCCLREGYRLFRTDRIKRFELTEQRYGRRRAELTTEWLDTWNQESRERPQCTHSGRS
jgi:predicted DNA-binding transcriptional regulator YafY